MSSMRQCAGLLCTILAIVVLAFPAPVLAKHEKGGQPPSYGQPPYAGPKGQQSPPYGPPGYAGPKHKKGAPPDGPFVPPGQAKKAYKKPKRHGPPPHAPAWGEREKHPY